MRRAAMALLGTAIGTTLLVGAKLGTPAPAGATDTTAEPAGADLPAPGTADPVPSTAGPTPATTPSPTATRSGGPSAKPTPTGGTKASPTRTTTRTTSAPKPPSGSGLNNGTFIGAAFTSEHGTIKVTITVSGGKMTDVRASYPTSPARTASINNDAIPRLRQEALADQTWDIDTISGATYTSDSYRRSLQSALDRAKA